MTQSAKMASAKGSRTQGAPRPALVQAAGLSVVVPAFNEEGAIAGVLTDIHVILTEAAVDFEIIAVDDGSHDRTAEEIGKVPFPVTLLRHETNQGYGAAIKTAIHVASMPLICITDADGTYPNARIPDLLRHHLAEKCDMTVGARTGDCVAIPPVRRPAKWAIARLANHVAGRAIPDVNSGLRIFSRKLALRMAGILPDGFSLTTTITLAMLSNGFRVAYLPIDYHSRVGHSKIRPVRDTAAFIQLILKMGLYFAPMRIFLPFGGILLLLAILWGCYTYFVWGRVADVSTLVLVMAAIQIGGLGLLAELINWRTPRAFFEDEE